MILSASFSAFLKAKLLIMANTCSQVKLSKNSVLPPFSKKRTLETSIKLSNVSPKVAKAPSFWPKDSKMPKISL